MWNQWDAGWYERIARDGYHAGDGTAHYSPLYPFVSHLVSLLIGGHIVLAELVVSSVAFTVALWLLYKVARLDVRPRTARLTVLLVACFPEAFFMLVPYTESLFLVTTLGAFWFARRGQPWAAGVAGFCAALTRVHGAFLVFPLAFEYLRRRRAAGERPDIGLAAAALPPLGLLGWNVYLRVIVGEPQSPLQIAARWGQFIVPPWQVMPASLRFIGQKGDPIEILNVACLLGATWLALYLVDRLPLMYALYVWPYLVLLFSTQELLSPYEGTARYTLPLFPCFILLAILLERRPYLTGSVLAIGILMQAFLFDRFVHGGFVA
jgi:Dolichyl-phosphate-mannose-protein mannosyltransferase